MSQTHQRTALLHKIDRSKLKFETPVSAQDRWQPELIAAKKSDDEDTYQINIYSTVGEYGDGSGMTPKIVDAILRKADGADVVVNINSPGGDFFDGLAIYTLLKKYEGDVIVNVIGMAASAASVIALAGGTINISKAAFFMIHNAWSIAIGNRNDMQQTADMLGLFDEAMQSLYAEATGLDQKAVAKMMDSETWIVGSDAVEQGFATAILGEEEVAVDDSVKNGYSPAMRKMDVALAKAGMPRNERRDLLKELTGTPRAAVVDDKTTPRAGDDKLSAALMQTLELISQPNA